jgi:outer membrane receptor protein involved in Fe transport
MKFEDVLHSCNDLEPRFTAGDDGSARAPAVSDEVRLTSLFPKRLDMPQAGNSVAKQIQLANFLPFFDLPLLLDRRDWAEGRAIVPTTTCTPWFGLSKGENEMTKFGLLSTSAIGSATLFAFVTPAQAADTATAATAAQPATSAAAQPNCTPDQANAGNCLPTVGANGAAADQGGIVVTGSRIRRPNVDSAVPIVSVGGEEFFQQGQNNIGDTLNELPQLRSTFSQSNAGRFLGTTGLNLLDLRGLGTQRTLVLVNGRRHVPADILNNGVSPDVNTIPNDLIERVDIVTGGNSAIYGSDAIAGVVNFILRRDYDGFQVRGQAGISEWGGGANQYVAAMWGHNFADGRGNITLHGEYAHEDRVYASDVPFLQKVNGFIVVETDPASAILNHGSDGIPDRVFFRDIRGANININSQIAFTQRTGEPGGPQCGVGFNGTPYNCVFMFSADGHSLVQENGTRVGTGPIGSFIGGNGPTNREGTNTTVFPRQDRYNFNLLAHYAFSDAFELFLEAKFVRIDTIGQNAGPAFIQGSTLDGFRERLRLDNPFLSPAERTQITNLLLQYNTRPGLSTATGVALTAGDLANIANGSFRVPIQRNFLDLGVRDEHSIRDTYRAVAGLRGTFNDDWTYEISANYGRDNEDTTVLGNVDIARLLFALDAGRNPATGQIQCRAQFDPTAQIDVIGDPTKLAQDIAACVPYNAVGGGANNEAARQYIVRDTISRAHLDQLVLSAFMSGDSSQWFSLPGGPVGFAIGAEYRREKLFYQADPFIENGLSFYNALPTFSPPAFEVKEAYGEIRIPILAHRPFFELLTVSGAARIADYNSGAGTVWAYNGNIEWAPVRDIRFRANYSRSVRAPALTETSFPLSQNFAPGFIDPCAPSQRNATGNRLANCTTALGANLGNIPDITQSLEIQSGSNPNLLSEVSDSWTYGAVIQPRWIPGLSFTADYYNIRVKNVIATLAAQTIVNACYDQPNLNNVFCSQFTRFAGPGVGPGNELPGQILQGSLTAIPLNFAALKRRGIDFELAYRHNIASDVRVDARLLYTHNLQISNFTNPQFPQLEDRIMSELGDPQDEFQFSLNVTHGPVTLGYRLRYISHMVLNLYEDFFPLASACSPTNGLCPPNNADFADRMFYPAVFYNDFRINVEIGRDYSFYAGVDNAFNRNPPLGLSGLGAGSAIYSVRGRNFFAGFRARF